MHVSYAGVNDAIVQGLGNEVEGLPQIALSNAEKQALPLLSELFPNYRRAVGPQCAFLLDQGRKIEVEAVINSAADRTTLAQALAR